MPYEPFLLGVGVVFNLLKPYSELDFSIRETKMVHLGPFWPEEVHFGPFRSANRTLVTPVFPWENKRDSHIELWCQFAPGKVSRTLSGHFLDTPEPRAQRALGTPRRTLPRTPPIFGDTLGDTPGTLRARRARETPVAGRRDRFSLAKQARFTYRTLVPVCPREKFMNWPFLSLVWFAGVTPDHNPGPFLGTERATLSL